MEPESDRRVERRLRALGLVIGVALAVALIGTLRLPAGAGALGADVAIVAAPTGELAVRHPGVELRGTALTPTSDAASGSVQLLNQTATTVGVRLHGEPDGHALDHLLWLEVTDPAGDTLYRGPLDGFRAWTEPVDLEPGAWRSFGLRAWLAADAGPGYVGRVVQIDLGFATAAAPEATP